MLEPTPVEKPLVDAALTHRNQWPLVYIEMRSVEKDDLLSDAEFCARHPRRSMTGFFEECGKIAGVNISTLRKYERAGRFYDAFLKRCPDLPPLEDERIASLSPDTIALVGCIDELVGKGVPELGKKRDDLLRCLMLDISNGKGLTRKQLDTWVAVLQDAKKNGRLDQCVSNFLVSLDLDSTNSAQIIEAVKGSRRLESKLRSMLLADASWLVPLVDGSKSVSGRIEIVEDFYVTIEGAVFKADLVAMESLSGRLVYHAFTAFVDDSLESQQKISMLGMPGADYVWAVFGEEALGLLAKVKDHDVGLMVVDNDRLAVARRPVKASCSDSERLAVCSEFLLREIAKPKGASGNIDYALLTI